MNVKTFIDKPVFSAVISIFLVLGGILGMMSLPVETYPDIAPPTIQVSAYYSGASADAVLKSVVAPLEEAINGVENMLYMTSSSTNSGSASITIYFKQGTDPDMCAVNVQNRVSMATPLLPTEVTHVGVSTTKRQTSMLQVFALSSPNGTYDRKFIDNYMKINVQPELLRLKGVGDVMVMGADYSMRIWLKPSVMAQYKLIPSDITAVLAEQNLEAATGTFGAQTDNINQYAMKYVGRLKDIVGFKNIVIKSLPNGEILKLQDVAKVELGSESYGYDSNVDGNSGTVAMIFQIAGTNATAVNNSITEYLTKTVVPNLPKDIELTKIMSSNDFLFASIHEVLITLIIAIFLVIFVVYFFLQDFRTTLIPAVGIIVSLVGTFIFLNVAGFSLNLLTLFALILVIGTVVDDAIVVVEAVQSNFDKGYKSAHKASVDAMKILVSPIFTTSLVFMAVFIPVTFMGGTKGTFYTQFGITMAVAVAISMINALTLSPALCALVLKPNPEHSDTNKTFASKVRRAYNVSYNAVLGKYKNGVIFFMRKKWLVLALFVVTIGGAYYLMQKTPTGFVPDEDQGFIMVNITSAPGNSLDKTNKVVKLVEERLKSIDEVEHMGAVAGYSVVGGAGSTAGTIFLRLKDWDSRPNEATQSVNAIIKKIYIKTSDIKGARIFAMAPGMIPGYGTGNGFELHLQDKTGGSVNEFFGISQKFIAKLNTRPEIAMAFSTFDPRYPQYEVSIDAAQCKRAGISPASVLAVIGGYYGGIYASNFNKYTKVYRVMVQADPETIKNPTSLNNIYVRNGTEMAPVSQFVKLKRTYGPQSLSRFNLYNSISVNGTLNPGSSTGDAIAAIAEVSKEVLPRGYGYEYGGITREQNDTSDSTSLIFIICAVFIYLILCALYESFFIPLAVLLSVPFGLFGSFLFAQFMGVENNIYLQTGLIMLIGLLSKTAILLTEYASNMREQGMSIAQAAFTAAKVRLRPILMTALTMVFGMLPLMVASGVGANGSRTLGTGIVGGMLVGTLALLFIVPSLFIFFQKIQEKFKPMKFNRKDDDKDNEDVELIESK